MGQFEGEDFGSVRIDKLRFLIEELEARGLDTGYAKRFFKVGEWGLAFAEVYYAAVENGQAYRELEVDIEPLNNFLAKYQYYADHLGFPLR